MFKWCNIRFDWNWPEKRWLLPSLINKIMNGSNFVWRTVVIKLSFISAAFELEWVICAPAFDHQIGNAAHFGVSESLVFTKSYKWKKQRWGKWKTEGYSARQGAFEDLQRCANSRWLTDGFDHNRIYNFSMWPDNVLTILCCFLASVSSRKVS